MSHLFLRHRIAESESPHALVFEDDIFFARDFAVRLFPCAWESRPRDGEILNFMSNHLSFAKHGLRCSPNLASGWMDFVGENNSAYDYLHGADDELWNECPRGYKYVCHSQRSDFDDVDGLLSNRTCSGIVNAHWAYDGNSDMRRVDGGRDWLGTRSRAWWAALPGALVALCIFALFRPAPPAT
jgi:GR25 family glycosyltransferase involved in LPS biosynthesis